MQPPALLCDTRIERGTRKGRAHLFAGGGGKVDRAEVQALQRFAHQHLPRAQGAAPASVAGEGVAPRWVDEEGDERMRGGRDGRYTHAHTH